MAGLPQKKRPGRPPGSSNKVTIISKTDLSVKRSQDGTGKRGPGRPRLIKPQAVDIPKSKVLERSSNKTAEHKRASKKASIKILRRKRLLRLCEAKAKHMGMSREIMRLRPFFQREKAVNVQDASFRRGGPFHYTNMKKKHKDEKGRRLEEDTLDKKKLMVSLEVLGTKRGRGRPRKIKNEEIVGVQRKTGATKVASVTVMVGKRGPGRPRKVPLEEGKHQVRSFNHNIWSRPAHYEECHEADHFQSPLVFIDSYKPKNMTQTVVSSLETEPSQISQKMSSPSVDLQNGWVSGVVLIKKDDDHEQRTEGRYPYPEAKPLAPNWIPEAAEYADSTLDNNCTLQWVVESTSLSQVPQSQCLGNSPPKQRNHQEDLLKELADFKSQLLSELAATKAQIREGAQLMRSAISGVSAEINRLGQILQPLVSVISASNVSQQGHPMTFVPRPPQDTPPDDIVNVVQPSAHNKTSFSNQEKIFAHSPNLATDCLCDEVYLVKIEDDVDTTQSHTPQAQSPASTYGNVPTAPTMLHHHQLNLCQSKSTSLGTPISSMNFPQPNMSFFGGLQGDLTTGLFPVGSFHGSPTTRSSQSTKFTSLVSSNTSMNTSGDLQGDITPGLPPISSFLEASSKSSPPAHSVDCVTNSSNYRSFSSSKDSFSSDFSNRPFSFQTH